MTDISSIDGVSDGFSEHYTPTTEEVELYFKQAVPEPYGVDLDNAFDRWLAEVKAQEAKAERERIKQRLWDDGYLYEMERDHVWALIDGDNSE